MDTHVKVLGVLYIAFSALGVLGALFLMLTLGGAAGIVGVAAPPEDAAIALPIIGITGMALVMMLLALSLPGLVTGWGLLNYKSWARILGLVLAVINLFNIPFGTALGIYALWVLLNKETERLFTRAATPAV
ncbi:MAG: hypothetical protein ACREH3_11440 [Geminicoccales bacterium]